MESRKRVLSETTINYVKKIFFATFWGSGTRKKAKQIINLLVPRPLNIYDGLQMFTDGLNHTPEPFSIQYWAHTTFSDQNIKSYRSK